MLKSTIKFTMAWIKNLLLLMMAVIKVSCLKVGSEAFSEMAVPHGFVADRTISYGKLLIGNGVQSTASTDTVEMQGEQSARYRSNERASSHLVEAKLKRLGPSVQCGDDAMTLRVPGPRMPHFLIDRGEGSPVPVSEIPASCGISVKRVRRDVSLVAPYRGCHVQQQGGSYVLPLVIMGAPVQMSCPASPPLPKVSCFPSGMVISLGLQANINIKVDGLWQPLLLAYTKCEFTLDTVDGALVVTAPFKGSCWTVTDTERHLPLMYGNREVTLSCPLTLPTTAPTAAPTAPASDPQSLMFPPFPWWYYPYHGQVPATQPPPTTPPTTPAPAAPLPNQPMFPMFHPQMFNPYQIGGAAAYPNYYHMHGFHHHYPLPTLPPPTVPTTTTTVAQPADPPQAMPYPMYPMFPHHFPFHHMYGFQGLVATTPATTTTTTPAAAQPEQVAGYPQMFPLYYGPQSIKSQVPPAVKYPFMPQFPQEFVFAPRSPKHVPRAVSPSGYRSRRFNS